MKIRVFSVCAAATWRRLGMAMIMALALAGAAGCGVTPMHVACSPDGPQPACGFTLTHSGSARIVLDDLPTTATVQSFTLTNTGQAPIERLELWHGKKNSLLSGPMGEALAPFTLLPAERLAVSKPLRPGQNETLVVGSLRWEMPLEPARAQACFTSLHQASIDAQGNLVLERPAMRSRGASLHSLPNVQWNLTAPFEHTRALVGWQAAPGTDPGQVEVWLSRDGRAWGRIPFRADRESLAATADLSGSVAGLRRFYLRLFQPQNSTRPLTLERVWIEREIETYGTILGDGAGHSFRMQFAAPPAGQLAGQLIPQARPE